MMRVSFVVVKNQEAYMPAYINLPNLFKQSKNLFGVKTIEESRTE